jgi:hypothetical protein
VRFCFHATQFFRRLTRLTVRRTSTKIRTISCTSKVTNMPFVPLQQGDVPSSPVATTPWSVFGT